MVSPIKYMTPLKSIDEKKHLTFTTDIKNIEGFSPPRIRAKIGNKRESQRWQVVKRRPATTKLPNTKDINHHHQSQKQVFLTLTLCISVSNRQNTLKGFLLLGTHMHPVGILPDWSSSTV